MFKKISGLLFAFKKLAVSYSYSKYSVIFQLF